VAFLEKMHGARESFRVGKVIPKKIWGIEFGKSNTSVS